ARPRPAKPTPYDLDEAVALHLRATHSRLAEQPSDLVLEAPAEGLGGFVGALPGDARVGQRLVGLGEPVVDAGVLGLAVDELAQRELGAREAARTEVPERRRVAAEPRLLPDVVGLRLPPRDVAAAKDFARPRHRAGERVARPGRG